ncbi:membrane-associated protein, putative [Bodo saltans]|uniref:Membrane-associated protein, putative n=1 Tax=Bodo saltans TaxID=75058 RepID=A0A0S4IY80_BODSA|nr:membrane-associated protein, putative [Bodo saltans]|eukprot:CUG47442.1 membrane-associated protein, putative [Bodo saltans]
MRRMTLLARALMMMALAGSCCMFISQVGHAAPINAIAFPSREEEHSTAIVIPCSLSSVSVGGNSVAASPFIMESHRRYVLSNCTIDRNHVVVGGALFLDLRPNQTTTNGTDSFFGNVSIVVSGGNVLPRLRITSLENVAITHVSNVSIHVDCVVAGEPTTATYPSNTPLSMFSVDQSQVTTFSNVTVKVRNVSLFMTVTSNTHASTIVAPLLYFDSTSNYGNVDVSGITLCVEQSIVNMTVQLIGLASDVSNAIAVVSIKIGITGSVENVTLFVGSNSTVVVFLDVINATGGQSQVVNPSIFYFKCSDYASTTLLANINMTVTGAAVRSLIPRDSEDSAAVITLRLFLRYDVVSVFFDVDTSVMVQNICSGSNCSLSLQQFPRVRVVEFLARENLIAVMTNMSFVATGTTFSVDTPKSALIASWQDATVLRNLFVNVTNCTMNARTRGLILPHGLVRSQALIEVSSNDDAQNIYIGVFDCMLFLDLESGSSLVALAGVVNLFDNISAATLIVRNVTMWSNITNGTVASASLPGLVGALTIGTSIVNMLMQRPSYMNVGASVDITVTDCIAYVNHASVVPSSGFISTMVGSIASIVNVVRSLANCTMTVSNIHVHRQFVASTPSLSGPLPA